MTEKLIKFFCAWAGLQFLLAGFVFLADKKDPVTHATLGMGLGIYLFWILPAAYLTLKFREPVKDFVQGIGLDWRLKFVLFATLLVLLEEAVTTSMTNTAPLYGVSMAVAHATASANYLDVVLTHSVVLLVPMFCVWAWLLSRYDFPAKQVFLLWGLSGGFMEVLYGGLQGIGLTGFWVLVYGLMIYLPAYCVPAGRPVRKPGAWLYAAVIIGVVIAGVIPGGIAATVIKQLRPPHYFPGVK